MIQTIKNSLEDDLYYTNSFSLVKIFRKDQPIMSFHNIKNNERIFLQNTRTNKFVGIPLNSTGYWDTGKLSVTPSPHIIQIINSDFDILRSGDTILIQGSFTNYPEYNTLYPAQTGSLWYDKLSENQPKQQWRIVKENQQEYREPIHHGDNVYISSVYYTDALLYDDYGFLGISYETVDKWKVIISNF